MTANQLYRRLCSDPFPGATVTLDGLGCNVHMRADGVHLLYDIDGWRDADGHTFEHQLPHPGESSAEEVHAELRRVLAVLKEYNALDSIDITSAQEAALSPLVRANRRALGLMPQATVKQSGTALCSYVALVALDGSGVWSVGEGLADAEMRAADHWRRAENAPKLSQREWLATLRAVTLGGELEAVRAVVRGLGDVDPFVPVELREVES